MSNINNSINNFTTTTASTGSCTDNNFIHRQCVMKRESNANQTISFAYQLSNTTTTNTNNTSSILEQTVLIATKKKKEKKKNNSSLSSSSSSSFVSLILSSHASQNYYYEISYPNSNSCLATVERIVPSSSLLATTICYGIYINCKLDEKKNKCSSTTPSTRTTSDSVDIIPKNDHTRSSTSGGTRNDTTTVVESKKCMIGCIVYKVHTVQSVLNNSYENRPSIPPRMAQFAIHLLSSSSSTTTTSTLMHLPSQHQLGQSMYDTISSDNYKKECTDCTDIGGSVTQESIKNGTDDNNNNNNPGNVTSDKFEKLCQQSIQQCNNLNLVVRTQGLLDDYNNNTTTGNAIDTDSTNGTINSSSISLFSTSTVAFDSTATSIEMNNNNNNNKNNINSNSTSSNCILFLKSKECTVNKNGYSALNFHGRGRMASNKNIQLIVQKHKKQEQQHQQATNSRNESSLNSSSKKQHHNGGTENDTNNDNNNHNNDTVLYQLAKWDTNTFHIDYKYPIQDIYAFAFGIAQLDL